VKIMEHSRPGPEVPRSHEYVIGFCRSPTCGMHLVAYDVNGEAICEVVLSALQTLELINTCKDFLYEKVAQKT
jgi:hypothetical protein